VLFQNFEGAVLRSGISTELAPAEYDFPQINSFVQRSSKYTVHIPLVACCFAKEAEILAKV
jgi:hypothetical protein